MASALDRFEAKVSPEPNSGCHLWIGFLDPNGYGRFHHHGGQLAHRFAYQAKHGVIPSGLVLDHLCRVRCCVNPDHLEPVTNEENIRRGINPRSAQTHCKRGHLLSGENMRMTCGARTCRACEYEKVRRLRAERREREGRPFVPHPKDRVTCKNGHAFDGVNSAGARTCKTCANARARVYAAARRAG